MKNPILHNQKYSQIKQRNKKVFVPNKTEVEAINEDTSEISEVEIKHEDHRLSEISNFQSPINTIDKYRVNIMVYVDSNADKYFKYCEHTFVEWCNNMGYTLTIVRKENNLNSYVTWNKIELLRDSLYEKTYDIVAVVDADFIINNRYLDIKKYLKPNKYVYMSSDCDPQASLVNSGFVFIINSDNSRKFIDDVWAERHGEYSFKYFFEQSVISILYNRGYSDIIEILDTRAVNSSWGDDKYNMPNNNVYHFMGRSLEDKVKYVKNHFDIKD